MHRDVTSREMLANGERTDGRGYPTASSRKSVFGLAMNDL